MSLPFPVPYNVPVNVLLFAEENEGGGAPSEGAAWQDTDRDYTYDEVRHSQYTLPTTINNILHRLSSHRVDQNSFGETLAFVLV